MFRNLVFSILIILLVAGALFITADHDFISRDEQPRISTRNEVELEFKPDLAVIVLAVETENINLEQAFKENNNKMTQVQESLSNLENIEIDTLNFQVNPRKKIVDKEQMSYYQISNRIRVTSHNLDNLSTIIKNSIESGANQVLSINYSLEDKNKAKQKVVSEAIKQIREKMEFVAKKMDRETGEIISLTINDRIIDGNNAYRMQKLAGAGEASIMTPISVPDIKVSANINAVFTLE